MGITAALNTDGSIKMTQADGKDIAIDHLVHSNNGTIAVQSYKEVDSNGKPQLSGDTETISGAAVATSSTRITGRVDLHSAGTYTATSDATAAAGSIFNNVAAGDVIGSDAKKLATVDIGTADKAQTSIQIIDSALAQVSGF